MKTVLSLALLSLSVIGLGACANTNEEYEARLAEAEARAQRAEAMAESALRAAQESEEKNQRMFDASQRK